mmetsp:Transcript_28235/g.78981  ORF Transcript_28235/g.78981 Transcript_28235/m.78981 type:complete len:201 (-) Transcript_28235:1435-2037(-)
MPRSPSPMWRRVSARTTAACPRRPTGPLSTTWRRTCLQSRTYSGTSCWARALPRGRSTWWATRSLIPSTGPCPARGTPRSWLASVYAAGGTWSSRCTARRTWTPATPWSRSCGSWRASRRRLAFPCSCRSIRARARNWRSSAWPFPTPCAPSPPWGIQTSCASCRVPRRSSRTPGASRRRPLSWGPLASPCASRRRGRRR